MERCYKKDKKPYCDMNPSYGGAKHRFQSNIEAVKTLKQCEEENRQALPEEQEILAKYVGWGGLSNAFDPENEEWKNEYAQLKEFLTPDEYSSAQETALTSFYTPPVIIQSVYKVIENTGLKEGNILEIIIPSLIQGMGKIKKCALAV